MLSRFVCCHAGFTAVNIRPGVTRHPLSRRILPLFNSSASPVGGPSPLELDFHGRESE